MTEPRSGIGFFLKFFCFGPVLHLAMGIAVQPRRSYLFSAHALRDQSDVIGYRAVETL